MTDPIKVETIDVPVVPVTVISSSLNAPVTGTVAVTPGKQPNLIVTLVSPLAALLVRFLNVYLGMVVGLLGIAMTSSELTAPDFWHLLLKCLNLAVGGAVVLSMKDIVTIFAGLEKKYPLLTGSV